MCSFDIFDSQEALDLYNDKDYENSLNAFRDIEAYLKQTHQTSAFVLYYIAINLDMLRDPFEAAIYINLALDTDPFNSHYAHSKSIIFRNIADVMQERSKVGAPHSEVQKIYELIKENGQVNSNVQFQYIRHLMRHKMYESASALIDIELERNPNDSELINYQKRCRLKLVPKPKNKKEV